MKRRSFLLAAASWSCRGPAPQRWEFAHAALGLTQPAGSREAQWALGELEDIAERAAAAFEAGGMSAAAALGSVLFDELGFAREVTSTELGFVLLPGVLRHRRGSCVGLGTLYLALAQALGFVARGVLVPGHFYVRHERPGAPRNVELLRRGEAMPDSWYRARYPVPGSATRSAYARALDSREVLGVIEYDIGNERRRQQRPVQARAAFARAVELCPDFAEARASLGAMQQLLGDDAAARSSYQAAQKLDPRLPGLAENMALLESPPGAPHD